MKTKIQPVELPAATVAGQFIARYSETGLVELSFPSGRADPLVSQATQQRRPTKILLWHRLTVAALKKFSPVAPAENCRRWTGPAKRNSKNPSGGRC